MKRVIIIGGGFGGLSAAKKLGGSKDLEVFLIDRRNHHLFQPLLYQVALAALSPADIAVPLRAELAQYKNVHVVLCNVHQVDLKEKKIATDFRSYHYDYLVMACGSKHSYFGKDDWESFAPGLKSIEQATEIRRRILLAFELAERTNDLEMRERCLTFVIVGGGPTGVELAGAVAEIARQSIVNDFKRIDPMSTRVILVEGGDRALKAFPPSLSKKAAEDLLRLGVEVRLNSFVTHIDNAGIKVGDEFIRARTIIWAAGVEPASLNKSLGVALDHSGRVLVEADLSLKEYSDVFVIGDQAGFTNSDGSMLPGLAPVASQQGRHVARNILAASKGKPRRAFTYHDKGMMATIGKKMAVVSVGGFKMSGSLAWLAWLGIHIFFLIGFKNKVSVLLIWLWSYLTNKKSARLILSKDWKTHVITQVAKRESKLATTTRTKDG